MAIYTTAEDVARVFRSGANGKVAFSDSALQSMLVRDANGNTNLATSVNQTLISASDDFQGQIKLKFDFTNATDFNVIHLDPVQKYEALVGSGDIATSFTTADGLLTVGAGAFGGTIVAGDNVTLLFDCHVSLSDVELFIEDAEIEIDVIMTEGGLGHLTGFSERLYEDTVPPAIKTVATYLAAHYIFMDVFAARFKDEDASKDSYANRWKKRAESILLNYVKATRRTAPSVLSFPAYVDRIGIRCVGPGTDELSSSEEDITREARSDLTQDGIFFTEDLILPDAE